MIVGTAGHIDHGKTALVRALTGVDTDRLPEEKARGISIELGYAFLDVPMTHERIGFIDVPGHERLVHTMISGATGIDFGLLLVAADDGVMPQTCEHLAVLSLLGLKRGAVVITKTDRVDAARIDEVRAQVALLLIDTQLAGAPLIALSAPTGEGVEALRELLFDAARETHAPHVGDHAFRLAIDRAFTLDGVGTVVTGTVHAGKVKVGDELTLVPSTDKLRARVRSLRAQNQSVVEANAGQRCAVGLVGIPKDRIERGQWLVEPAAVVETERLDATLDVWRGESIALRSGKPVHVHVGAKAVMGTIAVLLVNGAPADSVAPGESAIAQLVLRERIGAWRGDRVVLRDASASRTIAGGAVLDPFAPMRYRRTRQRAAELDAWMDANASIRLRKLIDVAPYGVSVALWSRAEGLTERAARDAFNGLPTDTLRADEAFHDALRDERRDNQRDTWALASQHRRLIEESATAALRAFHEHEPEMLGPDAARLRRLATPRLPQPLWKAMLASLHQEGRIAFEGAFVHLPEHGLRLSATDERLAHKIMPMLATLSFEGAWARDLAKEAREGEAPLRTTLARLARRGEVHQVVKDLCYAPPTIARLAAIVREIAAANDGAVTAGKFRDATGLGRKRAIQLLEYFDRVGMLRRVGDEHRVRNDTAMFM
jgi:selenocysteine-specific elongation factor